MPSGRCEFCGDWKEEVREYNGFLLCEVCTEKAKLLVAKELTKLAAPYQAKLRRDMRETLTQKKTTAEG